MNKAYFVHSRGCVIRNSSAKIPQLRTSSCSNSWTVQANALVDHGGFPLRAGINWSHSCQWTPAVHYTFSWGPFTTIWIHPHLLACCFLFLVLLVLRTIFKCASRVIFSVTALAASQWTNWWLHSCCVPMTDGLDEAAFDRLDSDPLLPGGGVCLSQIWWCGIGEEDDNEKMWEVLRNM